MTGAKQSYTVSGIISAKDEAGSVGSVIQGVRQHCDEVLLIDGNSSDGTLSIARSAGATCYVDDGSGKGAAMRLGIQRAAGDILVFIDADGSHVPDQIPQLIAPIIRGDADLVVGSRIRGGSEDFHKYRLEDFLRAMGSDIITLCINYRWNAQITESQNGFRAIRASVARQIRLRENLTTMDQEMIIRCLKEGHRVCEVPTREQKRSHGRSKIALWRVWHRYLWCLIREMLNL